MTLRFGIEPPGGFLPDPTLQALGLHAAPGAEQHSAGTFEHHRLLPVGASQVPVTVTLKPELVEVIASLPTERRPELEAAVSWWLDLDTNLVQVESHLAGDPLLGPLVQRRSGLRTIRYPTGFEAGISAVLGQQVSLAAGRTFKGRFIQAFSDQVVDGLIVFPEPAIVAEAGTDEIRQAIGLTNSRAATVKALATAFTEGLDLTPGSDWSKAQAMLAGIPGVGPWTIDYLSVRACGHADGFTPSDLVLRRALGNPTAREAARQAEAWSPWRAYALAHLWTEAASVTGSQA